MRDKQVLFEKQLANFILDDSYLSDYDDYEFLGYNVLVRLFVFRPEGGKKGKNKSILMPDQKGDWKTSEEVLETLICPIVKVIKIGNMAKQKMDKGEEIPLVEGEVYTVKSDDILGSGYNPEFMWLIQQFQVKGARPVVPEHLPETISNLEKYWKQYRFPRLHIVGEDGADYLTYLIPTLKIETKFSFNGSSRKSEKKGANGLAKSQKMVGSTSKS